MKLPSIRLILVAALAGATLLPAQQPAAQAPAPSAQPAPPASPDTVVAKVDGQPITLGEMKEFLNAMPAQNRQAALQNPEAFLRQFVLMGKLTAIAEEKKLDQQTPYKEQLKYQRQMILSTAGLNMLSQQVRISDEERRAYYEANQGDFAEVKTKVIYIPFLNALPKPGETKQSLTESEALSLAERLVAEARAGADFVALVKQHSKDEASRNRDGDFATLKKSDNIPQAVKDVIFTLKEGEVSSPVRQPNGFYIFRIENIKLPNYESLAATIDTRLHDQQFRKKMDNMRDSIDVKEFKPDLLKAP